jgi:lambda family phage portal protein
MAVRTLRRPGWFSRVSAGITASIRRGVLGEAKILAEDAVSPWSRPSFFSPADSEAVLGHAAARNSLKRSWLPAFVQDARYDITPGDRIEIIRKARYFEQTNGTVQKILDLIETNVVGNGILPTPDSGSERFNEAALEFWMEWCSMADLTSRQHFHALQAIMARTTALDGEIFVRLAYGEDGRWPRVQLIESHRVVSASVPREATRPWATFAEFDGILFDARGRPAFYIVTHDNDAFSKERAGTVSIIPADRMVHVFEPARAGQTRGLSLFASVLHDIHDLDDLQQYEMMASKDTASRTRFIKNATGQAPVGDGTVIKRAKQMPTGEGTSEERSVYYRRELGASTHYLKHGDEVVPEEPLRPTAAQQEFWRTLERKITRGVGLSYAALMDYEGAWGGAALRGALVSDNRFYDVRMHNLTSPFDRIYAHVMEAGVSMGRLKQAPKNFRRCKWQPPRRGTVDIGRESKAILDELRYGLRTEQDVLGELGTDHKATAAQREAEVVARLERAETIAKRFKVPTMVAYALLQEPPTGVYAAALADQEITDPKPGGGGNRPGGTPNPAAS